MRLTVERVESDFPLDLKAFPDLRLVELYADREETDNLMTKKFAKSLKKQRSALGRGDLRVLINGFEDIRVLLTTCGKHVLNDQRRRFRRRSEQLP